MASPARKLTREQELRKAILRAKLPPRDLKVYLVLWDRAQWNTAVIRDRWQPRSLDEIARWCGMSRAGIKRALAHLEIHGWLERIRHATGGRGHPTSYQLERGSDCNCPEPGKGLRTEPVKPEKGAQNRTIKGLRTNRVPAGQGAVSAKSVSEEGELERCPVCSTVMDPWLTANGYRTHINCIEEESQCVTARSA